MIDKQIHANELKLRILMTNSCNLHCEYCLNDFQYKPGGLVDHLFIDKTFAKKAILAYTHIMHGIFPLQIYFSGGEPTIHRDILDLMKIAKDSGAKVILNTNGTFIRLIENKIIDYADEIHFGIYKIDQLLAERVKRTNGSIQCIYSKRRPYVTKEFLNFYLLAHNLPVKVFQDFYENDNDYEEFISWATQNYPDSKLSFRYTGIQENRGIGCSDCTSKCITLKAVWLFPNNTMNTCPQIKIPSFDPENDITKMQQYFKWSIGYHKKTA